MRIILSKRIFSISLLNKKLEQVKDRKSRLRAFNRRQLFKKLSDQINPVR